MSEHLVFCIGRQFGSGGHEIGEGVAKKLNIPCYDKEILKQAAQESGIVEDLFEKADEKPTSSFLYTLSVGSAGMAPSFTNYNDYLTNDKLFLFQMKTIKEMADREPCVIIGRCADYILRGYKKRLSVFIHAPLELRIQRIAKLHNIDEDAARSM
ncbi:MAG: cytidylate kinase-like family protein, partial [Ruthenibacterium sp.]